MKKNIIKILLLLLTNCTIPKYEHISLKLLTKLENNKGELISLHIKSENTFAFKENAKRCEMESFFAFTYSTPQKRPKDRIQGMHKEWEIVKNGETFGRFKINKSDLYLLINNKKIYPKKIFWREYEYNTVESSSVAYANYDRYGTHYASFPTPCSTLTTPNAKLIIEKIYKDNKPIKQNIEFGFTTQENNKIYQIWLE